MPPEPARREAIFADDIDCEKFLATLAQACERTGWPVHAYMLMRNHYHLLVETPEANLSKGMHWLQCTYTAQLKRRHRLSGHLFQGRYEALVVEAAAGRYLAALGDYIHLNPVRAGLVAPGCGERLGDYRWSSYPTCVGWLPRRPHWLRVEAVLGELGLPDDTAGRRDYARHLRRRASEEAQPGAVDPQWQRGWCLGGEGFREKMLALFDGVADRVQAQRAGNVDGGIGASTARRPPSNCARQACARSAWPRPTCRNCPRMTRANKPRVASCQHTIVSNRWLDPLCNQHQNRPLITNVLPRK